VTINIRSRYQNVTAVSGAVSNISSLLQPQARSFVILSGVRVTIRDIIDIK